MFYCTCRCTVRQESSFRPSWRWLMTVQTRQAHNDALFSYPLSTPLISSHTQQVVRMALQVIAILSTSKAGLELEPSPAVSTTSLPSSTPPPPTPSSVISKNNRSHIKGTAPTLTTPHPYLNKYFRLLVVELLKMFDSDKTLLDRKASFIIR